MNQVVCKVCGMCFCQNHRRREKHRRHKITLSCHVL